MNPPENKKKRRRHYLKLEKQLVISSKSGPYVPQPVYPCTPPMGHNCTVCGIDMGPNNPRQLCGKWRCTGMVYETPPSSPKKLAPPPTPRKRKRERLKDMLKLKAHDQKSIEQIPVGKTPFIVYDFVGRSRMFVGYCWFEGFESLTSKQKNIFEKHRACCYFYGSPCEHNCSCEKSTVLYQMI